MTLCRENGATEISNISHKPHSKEVGKNLVNLQTNPQTLVKEMELEHKHLLLVMQSVGAWWLGNRETNTVRIHFCGMGH